MICAHIKLSADKWTTKFIPAVYGECLSTNLIKRMQRTKSWEIKVGYNVLREAQ